MENIYIHIPFCYRKCFYCDFYSIDNLYLINNYILNLIKEINLRIAGTNKRNSSVKTIFFGGGTPSILKASQIWIILNAISKYYSINSETEITLEANPGTVTLQSLIEFKSIGINRISLGVQSFEDSELMFLKRIHNSEEAKNSITNIINAGFDNFNIDLIFSIPNQTIQSLKNSLNQAISFEIPHLSVYSLIFEKGTPLYKQKKKRLIKPNKKSIEADMYSLVIDTLEHYNYTHYEVSNYAKSAYQCLHNLNYWRGNSYWGFGTSASGYINKERYKNISNVIQYNKILSNNLLPTVESEIITADKEIIEAVMLGLRSEGIFIEEFYNKYGISLKPEKNSTIRNLITNNFINYSEKISLTKNGFLLADKIILNIISSFD